MSALSQIKQFLAKPFPQEENFFQTLKIVTAISVFVVIFLYVFKPFGIHLWQSNQFLLCFGFGLVAFVTSVVYELFIVKVFKIKGQGANFTFGKWILYFLGAILFISLANFIFIRLAIFDDIQWSLYPPMMRGTFAIGIFPVLLIGGFALLKQERKYQKIAGEINQKAIYPVKTKQANGSIFTLPTAQIRYVEAMQNYINIGYIDEVGEPQEQLERATLKSISSEALGDSIVRCHRSFLVNKDCIESIAGNAQGLLLALSDCDKKIPVSRSYVAEFRGS